MTALLQTYAYRGPSALEASNARHRLRLVAATDDVSSGDFFFRGSVREPVSTASALLALGEVARTRFYTPPSMLGRHVEADPIITSDGERLRFETFSQCCSLYARLDLPADALQGDFHRRGCSNVDFGPELRAALARTNLATGLDLTIGQDVLDVRAGGASAIERRVPLAVKWYRALAEVQTHMSTMVRVHELDRRSAREFIRGHAKASGARDLWLVPSAGSLRLSRTGGERAVPAVGLDRMRVAARIVDRIEGMTLFGDPEGQSSAWCFALGSARLTLALTAENKRGFSGEGRGLVHGVGSDDATLREIRAQLHWGRLRSFGDLANAIGQDHDVRRALAALASRGQVGYDLAAQAYYWRELPFDYDRIEEVQPRLKRAKALVDGQAVRVVSHDRTTGEVDAEVQGSKDVYRVRRGPNQEGQDTAQVFGCSCRWYAEHRLLRGPCKHILATQLLLEELP